MSRLLTLQFLAWVAERPRRPADVRAAWQSTCPLNSAWEDALAEDLVLIEGEGAAALVRLTPSGARALAAERPSEAAPSVRAKRPRRPITSAA